MPMALTTELYSALLSVISRNRVESTVVVQMDDRNSPSEIVVKSKRYQPVR